MRALLEKIRSVDKDRPPSLEPRINGKGKGKETVTRYGGEVIEGEVVPVPRDPRKGSGFKRRPGRDAFYEVKYEVRHLWYVVPVLFLTRNYACKV